MRIAALPLRNLHQRPAFWGLDRDLKDVIESIENVWQGDTNQFADFTETEVAYLVNLDLPGVSKENLDIQLDGDYVRITGVRRNKFDQKVSEQQIKKSIFLPKRVQRNEIKAHLEDGVLYLTLPKQEDEKPKKISLTDSRELPP